MSTHTIHYTVTMSVTECARCGMPFGITDDWEQRRRQDHAQFYCPAGHVNVYQQETAAEKQERLRREVERKLANTQEDLRIVRVHLDQERAAAKRVAKRTAAGVCPCCSRSFVQLARHMKSQHPEHAT
jgi:hypothetical protein